MCDNDSLSFVGSGWNFLFDYIKNVDTHHVSFSSKNQVIKKLSPNSVWETYMKWTDSFVIFLVLDVHLWHMSENRTYKKIRTLTQTLLEERWENQCHWV